MYNRYQKKKTEYQGPREAAILRSNKEGWLNVSAPYFPDITPKMVEDIKTYRQGFDYDPEFLKSLSSITGGMFCETDTVKLLADTIKQLSPAERPLLGTITKE